MESVEFNFDTVKAEKAEAISLYNRKRNSALLLRFALFIALMFSASCLSSSSFSGAVDLLRQSEIYLNRPVFMFALLNLIIAVLFFLSGRKQTSSDIYDEYVAVGSHSHRIADVSVENSGGNSTEESKQIVPVDNAIKCDSVNTVTDTVKTDAVSDTDDVSVSVSDSVMVGEVKEKKRYGRSKSDFICRELGGSDDEMVVAEPRRKSMDDLSSEEFRVKIEKFIAAKKKCLIRENTAEMRG